MPVKIRLMRIGAKKRPFYRVVAVDERNKRDGEYLELLGTYNPITTPHEIILKQDLIDKWTKFGAVMSDGFLRAIGKAPQRPPRKPKREAKPVEATPPAPETTPAAEEIPIEAPSEAPVETPATEETTAKTAEAPAEQEVKEETK